MHIPLSLCHITTHSRQLQQPHLLSDCSLCPILVIVTPVLCFRHAPSNSCFLLPLDPHGPAHILGSDYFTQAISHPASRFTRAICFHHPPLDPPGLTSPFSWVPSYWWNLLVFVSTFWSWFKLVPNCNYIQSTPPKTNLPSKQDRHEFSSKARQMITAQLSDSSLW